MDRRTKYLESLILTKSSLDAQILGILGMGGMGKTTLARALFTRIHNEFEGHCFLENIREEWQKHNRLDLRKKLYAELLKEENQDSIIINMFVKERIFRKKVLIVLDDLDDVEQFENLVGNHELLCGGSRVIITTRDKQMLKNIRVDWIYMAEQLDDDEALQLFSLNAFKQKTPSMSFLEFSRRVIDYAAGMPLALKVLGSYLYSKSEEEWNCAVNKLKKFPNIKIQNILKISYDGLDDKEREIFLDVVCFFKGKDKDFVGRILGDDTFADVIRVLIDKCLIFEMDSEALWMHDLIQEMGWEVIRQESIKEPGKRSRLWITEDICHVLKNNTGSANVEGIFLNLCEIRGSPIKLTPTFFIEMYNLRLLQILGDSTKLTMEQSKLQLPKGLDTLPDSLRYLHWLYYPLNSLPSNFMPQNLVELNLSSSQLKQLSNEFEKRPWSFCGCSKWNVVKYKELVMEFSASLICQATYFGLKSKKKNPPKMNLCCPGNELVELCLNQSEGSSIDIYLSPFSYNSNFTGFYFCVIIEFDNYCFDINRLSFQCEYHFENNNGESNKRSWSFRTTAKNTSTVTEIGILNSDHMFMGFIHEEYDENLASCPILQVSFKFHLQQHDWEEVVNVDNYKVKKCGICTLNLEDLVEVFNNLDDHDSSKNNESEEMEIGMEDINSIFDNNNNNNNNVTYYREKQVTISEAHTIIPLELW